VKPQLTGWCWFLLPGKALAFVVCGPLLIMKFPRLVLALFLAHVFLSTAFALDGVRVELPEDWRRGDAEGFAKRTKMQEGLLLDLSFHASATGVSGRLLQEHIDGGIPDNFIGQFITLGSVNNYIAALKKSGISTTAPSPATVGQFHGWFFQGEKAAEGTASGFHHTYYILYSHDRLFNVVVESPGKLQAGDPLVKAYLDALRIDTKLHRPLSFVPKTSTEIGGLFTTVIFGVILSISIVLCIIVVIVARRRRKREAEESAPPPLPTEPGSSAS